MFEEGVTWLQQVLGLDLIHFDFSNVNLCKRFFLNILVLVEERDRSETCSLEIAILGLNNSPIFKDVCKMYCNRESECGTAREKDEMCVCVRVSERDTWTYH